ncbi:DcuS/MalK family sensor histidine kinase [Halobacillus sp. Marseille-Q1614]|uniref:DcuS/MalK family sensor histidine kinase n=1 Tax=Halobacillus sp. Marseille-Q1614 TaxID=2709134 RepID=UPI00157017CA|nr:DcuS/MalK family sensor histidine kinase [Halobacillus sp. Marseille-Q1614]
MPKPRFKLSTIIMIFVCLVVLVSLLITDLLITESTSSNIENQLEEKALIVSRIAAESTIVKNGLQNEENEPRIQEYAMSVQEDSEVLFVVVMDMNGIRKSHPEPSRIGNEFVGGDEKRALSGEEYISTSTGTLGQSVRAFTPVYDEQDNQIGAVSVGISLDAVEASVRESQWRIAFVSIAGVVVGIIGAYLLAKYIKKSLFGLEPYTIGRIHEERNQMLHSVYEGIIAIDKDATIVLVNRSAKRIFQKAGLMDKDPIGMKINEFLPGSTLDSVLEQQSSELDEEKVINGISIITNRVPIIVNDQVVGAIATFRDKTEINQLAEQLTGVQMYADTLRAQSHEFMNQLHVLLGMVTMEDYEQVKKFISKLVDHQAHEVGNITNHIKDPALAGFIIGKISYARESHVNLTVECETRLPKPKDPSLTHELITILGNVIDNAIESVMNTNNKSIHVQLSYIDDLLTMTVSDTGPGISKEKLPFIFQKGVSSKQGEHRGFGLYLVKNSVEKLEGSIEVDSHPEEGTTFSIIVPY